MRSWFVMIVRWNRILRAGAAASSGSRFARKNIHWGACKHACGATRGTPTGSVTFKCAKAAPAAVAQCTTPRRTGTSRCCRGLPSTSVRSLRYLCLLVDVGPAASRSRRGGGGGGRGGGGGGGGLQASRVPTGSCGDKTRVWRGKENPSCKKKRLSHRL
ncbi:hypothetical protein PR001_g17413 [Phytophthora rubi]|uniref:Secreted protein n=1 Tax=Phytophthora rubi TaxID=129364 RepID=A0A6A3KG39_9STRA|nr:hypothetical protein PR001_g17413 [Phytophthora rubi]